MYYDGLAFLCRCYNMDQLLKLIASAASWGVETSICGKYVFCKQIQILRSMCFVINYKYWVFDYIPGPQVSLNNARGCHLAV